MYDHHKSKGYGRKDMFNDTSRNFDDIYSIDNHEFQKYIPDIYPAEIQLNIYKAIPSDKETSCLDLNIEVIGINIHTSISTNAMTLDFLSLFSFADSHRTVFTFRSRFDLPGVVQAFLDFNSKTFKSLQNYWQR